MTFSILFWNIWEDNQLSGVTGSTKLLSEIKRIVDQYKPDYIGLNEVLQSQQEKQPFVSEYLKNECGYTFSHYAPASPLSDDWLVGNALYSRTPFEEVSDYPISNDTPAHERGYEGFKLKAITAKINLPGKQSLNIIHAHPLHLRVQYLKEHYTGTTALEKLVRSKEFSENTILGGDFNEPRLMPEAFRAKTSDVLHSKTGTSINPTWRYNAKLLTPLRLNLDYLYWTKNSAFELRQFEILNTNVSDHRPIFASFKYGN